MNTEKLYLCQYVFSVSCGDDSRTECDGFVECVVVHFCLVAAVERRLHANKTTDIYT
jgi:hypothetical protein